MGEHSPEPTRLRSWLASLALFVGTFIVFGIVLEVVFIAGYFVKDGRYRSVSEMVRSESGSFEEGRLHQDCLYLDTIGPHPYVAFLHLSGNPCSWPGVTPEGVIGRSPPLEKKADAFVILLLGGSVAFQMGGSDPGDNFLERELNRKYVPPKGSHFEVVIGAAGAWKQPQTFIFFSLYANGFDGVVTLDGFNEHYSFRGNPGGRFEAPPGNYGASLQSSTSLERSTLLWLDARLRSVLYKQPLLSHSKIAYFVIDRLRTVARSRAVKLDKLREKEQFEVWNPFNFPVNFPLDRRAPYNFEQYARYFRMTDALAKELHVKYLHFLQPVPAIDKHLTAEERKVVGDLTYRPVYQEMVDFVLALRREGRPIESLLSLFNNDDGTIYRDHIHLNDLGKQKVVAAMAQRMAVYWKLKLK